MNKNSITKSINLESLENLGIIVENEDLPSDENLFYYEQMAEAMKNLDPSQDESSKKDLSLNKSNKKNETSAPGIEPLDLYSINKSLYNSSKLFPPTERDIDFEMDSFQNINENQYDPNSLNQFNSFKNNEKKNQTDRVGNWKENDKTKLLSYFEVNIDVL